MTRVLFVIAAVAAVTVSGCAEYADLYTEPPAADIYVNGEAAGTTPLSYRVERKDVGKPLFFRVEKDGFEPVEGKFPFRRSGGRVTGMIFTLGVLSIFRSASVYDEIHIDLKPASLRPLPEQGSAEQRLRELHHLYETGLISEREFKRHKAEILEGVVGKPEPAREFDPE